MAVAWVVMLGSATTVTTVAALDGEAQTEPPEVIKAVAVYEPDVEIILEAPDPRLD